MKNDFILVGLGSIGLSHLKVICDRKFNSLFVYDTDPRKEQQLLENAPDAKFIHSLEAIEMLDSSVVVVVANWGPDHYQIISDLKSKGAKNFIVEKPIVSKLSDVESLRLLTELNEINLICNFSLGFSPLIVQLNKVIAELELGSLCNISVNGGAKCLATNGIHYLALANLLFESEPISVSSNSKNDGINPRNKDLVFLGGFSNWTYSNDRNLTISFSNNSHNQLQVNLEFEYGRVLIEGDQAFPFSIAKQDRKKIDKPSRTLYPRLNQKETFSISNGDELAGIRNLYEFFLSQPSTDSKFSGLSESEGIIAMMIASEEKKNIDLPLNDYHRDYYGEIDWKIS